MEKKVLKIKWVLKLKQGDYKLVKYKVQLVGKGLRQKKYIDFDKIISSIVKMSFIRVVLGLSGSLNLEFEQLDVKFIFLHRDLREEITWNK